MTLCVTANVCLAQPADTPPTASRMLAIGAGWVAGASMLLDPADNWKVSPVFAWRGNVDMNYPINANMGVWLSFGLDRRGGEFHWYNDKEVTERRMVNYFAVMPALSFKGLLVGLNLGFPMGGTRTYRNGTDAGERTVGLDASVDKLELMIEPRLGGVIPVVDEEIGMLGITISGGYNFGNMSERRDFMPGEIPGKTFATENASLHLGLTWLFGVPGTAR